MTYNESIQILQKKVRISSTLHAKTPYKTLQETWGIILNFCEETT